MAKTAFTTEFLKKVPNAPGVYELWDASGTVIYVGKAKRLRRRLSQYRNAKRIKKHKKMRTLRESAIKISFLVCTNEIEALLLENRLIQKLKPKYNRDGAFAFLYPVMAVRSGEKCLSVLLTSHPIEYVEWKLFGAYRSRFLCWSAFDSLRMLLAYVGHQEPHKKTRALIKTKHSYCAVFRMVDSTWPVMLENFLRGDSIELLEALTLALVEKPSARRRSEEIQEALRNLKRFYKFEATPLRKALKKIKAETHFVPQEKRDQVFILYRGSKKRAEPTCSF